MPDLRNAFDTINHYRILEKLSQCGVRGIVNKWFQSYLRNRKQAVLVNNKWSNFEPINCGVPQGSILGPLLFIIYKNDFPKWCPNVTTYLCADDANLMYSKKKSLTSCLDKELMNVPSWMSLNNSKNTNAAIQPNIYCSVYGCKFSKWRKCKIFGDSYWS